MMTRDRILDVDRGLPEGIPIGQGDAILAKYVTDRFSHVAAYHACDGRNLDAIRRDGLLPLDADRLRREAEHLFPHLSPDKVRAAVTQIEAQHFTEWYEDTVGVFVSSKGSLSTPWLKHPWFVWRLANFSHDNPQDADAFLKEYIRGGMPSFVRCVFPIVWIAEHIHPRYELFKEYAGCFEAISTDGYSDLVGFLYGIKGGVPPEFVKEFIPADKLRIEGNDPI